MYHIRQLEIYDLIGRHNDQKIIELNTWIIDTFTDFYIVIQNDGNITYSRDGILTIIQFNVDELLYIDANLWTYLIRNFKIKSSDVPDIINYIMSKYYNTKGYNCAGISSLEKMFKQKNYNFLKNLDN